MQYNNDCFGSGLVISPAGETNMLRIETLCTLLLADDHFG